MNLGPTFDRSCWLDVKETLGLDFPNVSIYHHVHFFLSDLQRNRRFIRRFYWILLNVGGSYEQKQSPGDVLQKRCS